MNRTLSVHVRIDPPNPHPNREELAKFFDGEIEELERHLRFHHPDSYSDGLNLLEKVTVKSYLIFLCERQQQQQAADTAG